jgi:putative FmdB family regulatory protein
MPTYTYRCKKCRHRFELFHSITDESVKRCPRCRGKAERVPSAGAGILFKGSGFYITDYRSKSYKEKAKQEKAGGSAVASGSGDSGGGAASGGTKSSGEGGSKPERSKPGRKGDSSAGGSGRA